MRPRPRVLNGHQRAGRPPSVVILGAGFSGICLGIRLKKAGIQSFRILERAPDLGGVWRDNVYPGAGCDIPSHLYSFSFEHQYPWTRRYAPQAEILAYLRHCAKKYALSAHIAFNVDVRQAVFDAEDARWRLTTKTGETIEAQVFVAAVGQFSQPIIPPLPGLSDFAGPQFHSSAWDRSATFEDKTVAVIGTGASAIQFVPRLAKVARKVIVFQRSAPYVLPKSDTEYSPTETARLARYPLLQTVDRLRIFMGYQVRIPRRHLKRVVAKTQQSFNAYLASLVADPGLLRKLTPDEPWGCKRVLFSNDWYPALTRPNVTVVTDRIESVTVAGLRLAQGRTIPADVLIHGTGFQAANFLSDLSVQGLGGRQLKDAWNQGSYAHLGVTVSGFPNFFILFGPNTNVAGSVVYMLECQARYVVSCIRSLMRTGATTIDVKQEVEARFNADLQKRLSTTVWHTGNCRSWFKAASGKITTQWPRLQITYRMMTARAKTRHFTVAK